MQKAVSVQISYASKHLATLMQRIKASNKLPAANKQAVDDLVLYHQSQGHKINSVLKNVYCFERFLLALGVVEVPKATKLDMERAFAEIESQEGMAGETKRQIRVVVKQYFKHRFGDDIRVPEQVLWLKTTAKATDNLLPTDLIDEDDVLKMIDVCKSKRDRALLALLFERGPRSSSLLSMHISDVNLTENPPYVIFNVSKTRPTRVPIWWSAGFIEDYMAQDKIKELSHSDLLWREENKNNEPLDYYSLRKQIRDIADRAHLKKRIHVHLFRHSAASRMASEIPESVLREIMSWSKQSDMPSRYVHLSGATVDRSMLAMDGVEPEEHTTKLKVWQCPQCKAPNLMGAYHCYRCQHLHETIKDINDIMKNKSLVRAVLARAIQSDEGLSSIIKELR